jgi:hypothetical protein
MIVIIGLLVLIAAAALAVAGVATNSGSAHPLGDTFVVFGQHLNGLSTGQLFLYGIVVGIVGMLGLSMLLGAFNRRLASRGSRRELKESRRETAVLRDDRDRLVQRLDDEHTESPSADPGGTGPFGSGPTPSSSGQVPPIDRPTMQEPDSTDGSSHRQGGDHRAPQ